jgi:hypothetical protein
VRGDITPLTIPKFCTIELDQTEMLVDVLAGLIDESCAALLIHPVGGTVMI